MICIYFYRLESNGHKLQKCCRQCFRFNILCKYYTISGTTKMYNHKNVTKDTVPWITCYLTRWDSSFPLASDQLLHPLWPLTLHTCGSLMLKCLRVREESADRLLCENMEGEVSAVVHQQGAHCKKRLRQHCGLVQHVFLGGLKKVIISKFRDNNRQDNREWFRCHFI